MNKLKVKNIIQEKEEYSRNCNGRLCDYFVKVVNLRERKRYYLADLIIKEQNGNQERINDCEYNKQIFKLY